MCLVVAFSCDVAVIFSYRHTENTVAALQLPGRRGRLLAQTQLAEHLRTDLRDLCCATSILLALGGTLVGHGERMRHSGQDGGLRLQLTLVMRAVRSYSLPPCSWKQKCSHYATSAARSCSLWALPRRFGEAVIILLPGGKISHCFSTHNASFGI